MKLKHILTATALIALPCWATPPNNEDKNCIEVAIFSINDFHGALVPNPAKGLPGAPSLVQTLDSLKKVYPFHLTITAGDNFGGSFFYKATRPHTLMPQFFHDMDIEISAVGNHEWDDGKEAMAKRWKDAELYPKSWKFEYVCANTRQDNGQIPDYMVPYKVDSIKIAENKYLKVGFVGLLTSNTPLQASKRNLKGLHFDGNYPAVLDSLNGTKGFDAIRHSDIRLILTHIGSEMENGKPVWVDKDINRLHDINDPMYHGIISSHSHQLVCGRINKAQYPIVQGKSHGTYICCLKYKVDTTTMKVIGAVPDSVKVPYLSILNPKARRLNAQIEEQLALTLTPGGVPIGTPLTYAKTDIPHDRDHKHRQAIIGKWVCTSYAEAARNAVKLADDAIVVGVSHIGSIRTGFVKGPVSVLDVGEVLPFSNNIRLYKLNGRQLTELIQMGLHNHKYGHIQMGNLEAVLDQKGNVEKLIYMSTHNEHKVIRPDDTCYLAADEFMTNGGDGYPTHLFPAQQEIKGAKIPQTTDAFVSYLKSLPFIEE